MFLLVLALVFLSAQLVMKNREVCANQDDYLLECQGCGSSEENDDLEEIEADNDVFIIKTGDIGQKAKQIKSERSESWMQEVKINNNVLSKMLNFLPEK